MEEMMAQHAVFFFFLCLSVPPFYVHFNILIILKYDRVIEMSTKPTTTTITITTTIYYRMTNNIIHTWFSQIETHTHNSKTFDYA